MSSGGGQISRTSLLFLDSLRRTFLGDPGDHGGTRFVRQKFRPSSKLAFSAIAKVRVEPWLEERSKAAIE